MPPRLLKPAMSANNNPIKINPATKPSTGEVNIGTTTFQSSPLPFQNGWSGCDQINAPHWLCEAASAVPHRPPIKAWLDDEGRPRYQVIKFQMIAPSNAQMMIC